MSYQYLYIHIYSQLPSTCRGKSGTRAILSRSFSKSISYWEIRKIKGRIVFCYLNTLSNFLSMFFYPFYSLNVSKLSPAQKAMTKYNTKRFFFETQFCIIALTFEDSGLQWRLFISWVVRLSFLVLHGVVWTSSVDCCSPGNMLD